MLSSDIPMKLPSDNAYWLPNNSPNENYLSPPDIPRWRGMCTGDSSLNSHSSSH